MRDPEQREQFVIPGKGMYIEQEGTRSIAWVGDVGFSACQVPDQPTIDRAKGQFSPLGARTRVGYIVQQPSEFGA